MKAKLIATMALLVSAQFAAAGEIRTKSLNFAAPLVSDHSSLPGDTQFGSIIYDNTAGTFMGLGANGSWQPFTGVNTSLSNLSSTAVNTDILPASNDAINLGNQSGNEWASVNAANAVFDGGNISIGSAKFGFSTVSSPAFYGPTNLRGLIFQATNSSPDTYLYIADGSNLVLAAINGGTVVTPSHIRSASDVYSPGLPSASATSNAGSSGTCTVANGTDVAGEITVTPGGTGIASGTVCNLTFGQAYVTAPICSLTPANAAAGANAPQFYVGRSTTVLAIGFVNAGATTSYTYNYHCIETQ